MEYFTEAAAGKLSKKLLKAGYVSLVSICFTIDTRCMHIIHTEDTLYYCTLSPGRTQFISKCSLRLAVVSRQVTIATMSRPEMCFFFFFFSFLWLLIFPPASCYLPPLSTFCSDGVFLRRIVYNFSHGTCDVKGFLNIAGSGYADTLTNVSHSWAGGRLM